MQAHPRFSIILGCISELKTPIQPGLGTIYIDVAAHERVGHGEPASHTADILTGNIGIAIEFIGDTGVERVRLGNGMGMLDGSPEGSRDGHRIIRLAGDLVINLPGVFHRYRMSTFV